MLSISAAWSVRPVRIFVGLAWGVGDLNGSLLSRSKRDHSCPSCASGKCAVDGPSDYAATHRDELGQRNRRPLRSILSQQHEAGLFVDLTNHAHGYYFDGLFDALLANLDPEGA